MGAWGVNPWDNDGAADWFGDLFDNTGFAKQVAAAFELDPQDYHEEIRAAAYVLSVLCRTYVWPVDEIDRHLALGVAKLEEIKRLGIYEEGEFATALETELKALKSRMQAERPPSE